MSFKPEGIIIHCSATQPDWMQGHKVEDKVAEIRKWHLARGWKDIGYARVYDRDGSRGDGRDLNRNADPFDDIGAHTAGYNSKAIGLCLLGGYASNATDQFSQHFTPQQDAALREDIAMLMIRYPSIKWVKGHNDFAAKACPGFNVREWFHQKPAKGDSLLSSNTNKAGVLAGVAPVLQQVATPLLEGNKFAQNAMTIGLIVLGLMAVGYIIYSRVQKQQRGIL